MSKAFLYKQYKRTVRNPFAPLPNFEIDNLDAAVQHYHRLKKGAHQRRSFADRFISLDEQDFGHAKVISHMELKASMLEKTLVAFQQNHQRDLKRKYETKTQSALSDVAHPGIYARRSRSKPKSTENSKSMKKTNDRTTPIPTVVDDYTSDEYDEGHIVMNRLATVLDFIATFERYVRPSSMFGSLNKMSDDEYRMCAFDMLIGLTQCGWPIHGIVQYLEFTFTKPHCKDESCACNETAKNREKKFVDMMVRNIQLNRLIEKDFKIGVRSSCIDEDEMKRYRVWLVSRVMIFVDMDVGKKFHIADLGRWVKRGEEAVTSATKALEQLYSHRVTDLCKDESCKVIYGDTKLVAVWVAVILNSIF